MGFMACRAAGEIRYFRQSSAWPATRAAVRLWVRSAAEGSA